MTDTEFLTPQEVAKILRISPDTVIRKFSGYRGGVVVLEPEKPKYGRSRRTMRIPRTSLVSFIAENQVR